MIDNLNDLVAFTLRLGQEEPLLRRRVTITKPGCSDILVEKLKAELPEIPHSYIQIVQELNLNGIDIGFFRLSPGRGSDFAEKIISFNRKELSPFAQRFQADSVYQVAAREDDPVCVVFRTGNFNVGEVVMYDIENPQQQGTVLAETYERFLLIAGNLAVIRAKFEDEPADGFDEFLSCLEKCFPGTDSGFKDIWQTIAEGVLS